MLHVSLFQYISDMNFKIIDEQGEIGDAYPNDTERSPQNITAGVTCKSQMVLCVNNESSKVKLQYFDNMFNSQLNKNLNKPPVLIKEFTDNIIKLKTNDTKFLNDGVYTYGVVLKTKEGQINTIQQGEFIILKGFC